MQQLDPGHVRHVDVEQEQVEALALEAREGFGTGRDADGGMTEGGQDLLHDLQVHRIIVDVQHLERPADGVGEVGRHGSSIREHERGFFPNWATSKPQTLR